MGKGNKRMSEEYESIVDRDQEDDGVEDYDTLDVQKDDGEAPEYPNMNIKIERDQYSIFELLRKYDKDKISLDPSFQRNFVWSKKQMSELIESVIMGIPLPLIYLAENKDGKMIVVDGRQRLTTFFGFLKNGFKLDKLKILPGLNGKDFKALERDFPKYAAAVEDYQLIIQVIKYPTPDRVRFDIFDRVNRGGTPLNKQEMRNALYQGRATELLESITKSEEFLNATNRGISDKHMKDRYIVLRAIAFCLLNEGKLYDLYGKRIEYKSDIDDLTGRTMDMLNHLSNEEISQIKKEFDDVMINIHDVLGNDAFRLKGEFGIRRPISMTLFETYYYLFHMLKDVDYDKSDLCCRINNLLDDKEYIAALQKSVDSASSASVRFGKVIELYEEVINDKQTTG